MLALQLLFWSFHLQHVHGFKGDILPTSPPVAQQYYSWKIAVLFLLTAVWVLLPIIVTIIDRKTHYDVIQARVSLGPVQVDGEKEITDEEDIVVDNVPETVLVASIEHIIHKEGKPLKVVAGGLGKVSGLLASIHPTDFISVHPCMSDQDYSFASVEQRRVRFTVSGEAHYCDLLKYECPSKPGTTDPNIVYYMVDSPLFRDRPEGIYPFPQSRLKTLQFFSLWSQAVAYVMDMTQPDLYHCPDFHTAMAVMYVKNPLPIVVILHNAEYQGMIGSQLNKKDIQGLAKVFNVTPQKMDEMVIHDGQFNMLKPVVQYVRKHQAGYGVAAVSRNYANEAFQKHSLFWTLPEVRGIENCMVESERGPLLRKVLDEISGSKDPNALFMERKQLAKANQQKELGLNQDPDARMFVFLGRWVKQKGMDHIADITEWMMKQYPNAQLLMIGPPGDCYGKYSASKLTMLAESGKYDGRLFVAPRFMMVSEELKLACEFCFMPSRDEPFGYVDIEFGWYGALTVGAFRGGLGKVPGFYYQIANADGAAHIRSGLKQCVVAAMECDDDVLAEMSLAARTSSFPEPRWKAEMCQLYATAIINFEKNYMPEPDPISQKLLDDDLNPVVPSGKANHRGSQRRSTVISKRFSTKRTSVANGTTEFEEQSVTRRRTEFEPGDFMNVRTTMRAHKEFLRQDATDDDLQDYLEELLNAEKPLLGCDEVMKKAFHANNCEQEDDPISKFLMREVCGMVVFDTIACLSYITAPITASLFTRGIGARCQDTAYEILYPFFCGTSILLWTLLSLRVPPHLLMFLASSVRVLVLLPSYVDAPFWLTGSISGLIDGGALVFLYFNFMAIVQEDMSKMALRVGTLIALYQAPLCYRLSNTPNLQLDFFRFSMFGDKGRVLRCIFAAIFFNGLGFPADSGVVNWRSAQDKKLGFTADYNYSYGVLVTIVPGVIVVFGGLVTSHLPDSTVALYRAYLAFTLPSRLLRLLAMTVVGDSFQQMAGFDVLSCFSYGLGTVEFMVMSICAVACLGSRWRFIAFWCVVEVSMMLGRALGAILWAIGQGGQPCQWTGTAADLALLTLGFGIGPALLEWTCKLPAFMFFERESIPTLLSDRARKMIKMLGPVRKPKQKPRINEDYTEKDVGVQGLLKPEQLISAGSKTAPGPTAKKDAHVRITITKAPPPQPASDTASGSTTSTPELPGIPEDASEGLQARNSSESVDYVQQMSSTTSAGGLQPLGSSESLEYVHQLSSTAIDEGVGQSDLISSTGVQELAAMRSMGSYKHMESITEGKSKNYRGSLETIVEGHASRRQSLATVESISKGSHQFGSIDSYQHFDSLVEGSHDTKIDSLDTFESILEGLDPTPRGSLETIQTKPQGPSVDQRVSLDSIEDFLNGLDVTPRGSVETTLSTQQGDETQTSMKTNVSEVYDTSTQSGANPSTSPEAGTRHFPSWQHSHLIRGTELHRATELAGMHTALGISNMKTGKRASQDDEQQKPKPRLTHVRAALGLHGPVQTDLADSTLPGQLPDTEDQ